MSVWLEHGKASWDFRGQGKNGGGVVPAYSRKNCTPVIRESGCSGSRAVIVDPSTLGKPVKSRVPWKTSLDIDH